MLLVIYPFELLLKIKEFHCKNTLIDPSVWEIQYATYLYSIYHGWIHPLVVALCCTDVVSEPYPCLIPFNTLRLKRNSSWKIAFQGVTNAKKTDTEAKCRLTARLTGLKKRPKVTL